MMAMAPQRGRALKIELSNTMDNVRPGHPMASPPDMQSPLRKCERGGISMDTLDGWISPWSGTCLSLW